MTEIKFDQPQDDMRCPVCDNTKWKDLDHLRDLKYWIMNNKLDIDQQIGFILCETCGFMTYRSRHKDGMKKYYKDQYRSVVTGGHVIKCSRKNILHKTFLDVELKRWAKQDKSFLDFGCAQGAVLDMLHQDYGFKKENLFGTEWTDGFRNFGNIMYGLNITEDVDDKRKYDVIMLYKVWEHMEKPDEALAKLKGLLNPGGYMYISIPTWLDILETHHVGDKLCDSFEERYHLDHINAFTYQSARNILNKCGLKIVKENKLMYQWTFLCKPCQPSAIVPEDPKLIERLIAKEKKAIGFLAEHKFYEAVDVWPKYPSAIAIKSANKENFKSYDEPIEILEKGLKLMPGNASLLLRLAEHYIQWDGTGKDTPENEMYTNNIKKAERLLHKALKSKPANENVIFFLAQVEYVYKNNPKKAIEYFLRTIVINQSKFMETMTFIGHVISKKKFPQERKQNSPMPSASDFDMITVKALSPLKRGMGFKV